MSDPGTFHTSWPGVPEVFSLGCVTFRGLPRFEGDFYYSVGNKREQTFRLEQEKSKADPGSWVWVHMDSDTSTSRGLGSMKNFAGMVDFYRQGEKQFRLDGGKKFDPSMLALSVPTSWTHDAFQARPHSGPGRTIVHTYVGGRVGVIIRYLRPAADIADYDRFHAINAALTIAADQWVTLPDYLDIYSADHPKASPLDEQTAREVLAAVVRAKARLSLPGDASPAKVQQAIYEFVDTWLTSKAARKGQDATDVALELGCAWGQSVCDALGWQWRAITREGSTAYAVVSPDLACFVPPMIYLERQLTQRGRETDNTTLLLFNMLKAGETGGRPGSLRQLG